MIVLETSAELSVPKEIAVCPYCETALTACFDSWSKDDDGTWLADACSLDCETEPDIDYDRWEGWIETHSDMPYVYLLPVTQKVLAWVNQNYRFKMGLETV